MTIFASRGRVLRVLSVLSGGAAVVLLLGAAASPSSAGKAPARAPVVAVGGATTSGGAWGQAKEVAAALNTGGVAELVSVSCASAGNCSAAGFYSDSSGGGQAFVVTEANGTWGKAKEVAAALNTGGSADLVSVSCASAGNCTAGGHYKDSSGTQAFVVTEAHGTWGQAKEVAAALNTGGFAGIDAVSCAAAGNCTAGGSYMDTSGRAQAFVVTEVNGTWGQAKELAAALNTGGDARVASVSCPAAGNCSAGGSYRDSSGPGQAFAVNEANGTWGRVKEVAAALNTGGDASVNSVSCASAGNCSAGGSYTDSSGVHAFAVNEAHGTWGQVKEVAAALNTSGFARTDAVSCPVAGNCSAGGIYGISGGGSQAFAVNEGNGTWGKAKEVAAALNTGLFADVVSVSCASAGNCSAGGFYSDSSGRGQAFVVTETNGTWGQAKEVAAALNTGGDAGVNSVSCAPAGNCSAGGFYSDGSDAVQAFVVSKP